MTLNASKSQAQQLTALLDEGVEVFLDGRQLEVSKVLDKVISNLYQYRAEISADRWGDLVNVSREHSFFGYVQHDPFTRRAFEKPRGYAGDAILLDFIYGQGNYRTALKGTTALGRMIYTHNRMSPACRGVRNRRDLIATEIGDTLKCSDHARILSVAGGHLREAEQIPWEGVENLDLFLVLDQDDDSLREVASQQYHSNFITSQRSIKKILTSGFEERDFDLVYVTGLYDYLQMPIAVQLTEMLVSKLKPKGKLLVANFVPTTEDVGYMEVFMDWFLTYRDEAGMKRLASAVNTNQTQSNVFLDASKQICFLEITRSA